MFDLDIVDDVRCKASTKQGSMTNVALVAHVIVKRELKRVQLGFVY